MVQFVLDSLQAIRTDRGHLSPGVYSRDSWMWRRAIAMRRYANDFRDRLDDKKAALWKVKNFSWNQAQVFTDQNKARMSRDYGSQFFAVVPEGVEDGHPALRPAERYFHARAEEQNLGDMIVNQGILGALIRGESVYRALPARKTQRVKKPARLVLVNGVPLKDSKGDLVTEFDVWLPDPLNATQKRLARDPTVIWHTPDAGPLPLSETTREVLITTALPTGCDLSFPFWADFYCSIYAPSLDAAEVKGHAFEMKADDLLDLFPRQSLTPAAECYYDTCMNGSAEMENRPERAMPIFHQGEMDKEKPVVDPCALGNNTYAEVWFRYDADGDKRREDLMLLVDVGRAWPIAYGTAEEMLGSKDRKHPYGSIVCRPQGWQSRWYGMGHYEAHFDLCEMADADLNRGEIEKAKSGNLIFENPNATEEGKAGIPLAFRGPSTFRLIGQATGNDAVSVVTVQPQLEAINDSLEKVMQALTSRGGMLTPGEAEASNLQAAQTLGGLQILDQTKTVANDDLEGNLSRDIDHMLTVWAEMEVQNPDQEMLHELLEGSLVPVPVPPDPATGSPAVDPATGQPAMQQVPEAQIVLEWLGSLKGRKARRALKFVRSKSRGLQVIANQQNVKTLLAEYARHPAPMRQALRETYIAMLQALDESNPQAALDKVDEAMTALESAAAMAAVNPDGTPTTPGAPVSDPEAPAPLPMDQPPPLSEEPGL